ncbi:MAG: sigma-70 family RNA polymerase sigma factor [Chloroflexota bacterium]|nr:sigma-70 family RNA polymerase sigma factor [Chloroflexota bacterium]
MNLTEKWQSGDVNAFESLFRMYKEMVFRIAYLMVSNEEDAKDVLQEVFITVWKARSTFDPAKGKLTTWLHRITVNHCLMRHRKRQPVTASLEETGESVFDLLEAGVSESPEEIVMSRWEYERLVAAINSLDGKYRPVFILRHFDDLSYEEIACAMNIPLGTVKSRLSHAMKTLREVLVEVENEECR